MQFFCLFVSLFFFSFWPVLELFFIFHLLLILIQTEVRYGARQTTLAVC